MSDLYDDSDVTRAAKAILADDMAKGRAADEWKWADQSWLKDNARAALDAVAPLIAAKALRSAAGAIFNGATDPEQELYDAGVNPWLMRRADEIGLGQS